MASTAVGGGRTGFLTFRTVTFWMMMLPASRRWMPSWSKTAPLPTPTIVTLLICLSSITPAAVLQLLPETLVVLPWLMVPSTSMTIGVLLLARPHRAAWIWVPVVARTGLAAGPAGGPAVLGRVPGGAAGRRRRRGRRSERPNARILPCRTRSLNAERVSSMSVVWSGRWTW
ncbi:hypothetical protein SMICM17S_03612 [Streptomyces microflavus]